LSLSQIALTRIQLKSTIVYDTFWKFAELRQNIFFDKIHNEVTKSHEDFILNKYKFTNAYRASDRVSQYLIKNVIYNENSNDINTLFRIILFKLFNKIETWEHIVSRIGQPSLKNYSVAQYKQVLDELANSGNKLYSSAYIMPSGKTSFNSNKKHVNNLLLIDYLIKNKIFEQIIESKSLKEVFQILISQPTLGKFLAFQYAIDINYSEVINYSEMDFVVAGPGALNGISKCFLDSGSSSPEEIIKYVTDNQEFEFDKRGIKFKSLWGRPLQLIDIQNLFCEIDKYSRVKHPEIQGIDKRTRIKRLYKPSSKPIDYFYPPKWNINPKIRKINRSVSFDSVSPAFASP